MKKFVLAVSFLVVVLIYSSQAIATTQLNPGTTTFTYQPIFLYNVTDITGTTPLGLDAASDGLRIFWNAYFCKKFDKGTCTETFDRNVSTRCYYNCVVQKGDLVDTKCSGQPKCEFTGFGPASCTISNPVYLAKTQNGNNPVNNVTCKFFDPTSPGTEFVPYPNRTFNFVSFDTKVSSATITVGNEFALPIKTTNFGLLGDSYTVKTRAINNPGLVSIGSPNVTTEKINYGKTAVVDGKINILYTTMLKLEVMSKSNTEPLPNFQSACTTDAECSYLTNGLCRCPNLEDSCATKRCWIRNEIDITAKDASMSEYGLFGFLQIIIIATAVLVFKKL